jgi:hypothetical protein
VLQAPQRVAGEHAGKLQGSCREAAGKLQGRCTARNCTPQGPPLCHRCCPVERTTRQPMPRTGMQASLGRRLGTITCLHASMHRTSPVRVRYWASRYMHLSTRGGGLQTPTSLPSHNLVTALVTGHNSTRIPHAPTGPQTPAPHAPHTPQPPQHAQRPDPHPSVKLKQDVLGPGSFTSLLTTAER